MQHMDPTLAALLEENDEGDVETKDYDDIINGEDESPQPLLGDTVVDLPGGIITEQGVVTKVSVRELNGYDEEELARSDVKQPIDYLTKLLKLGLKEIGGKKPSEQTLNQLLIGDRNAIIIGIRRATFGNEMEMPGLKCPECLKDFDVIIGLDEFEMKKLDDPVADRSFEVKLQKGKAKLRLATHGDVVEMIAKSSKPVEQNNVMLLNCIVDLNSTPLAMSSVDPEEVIRQLGMRDRQVMLDELDKRQPGPDMLGVKITCPNCDYEDRIGLDLIGMFRI